MEIMERGSVRKLSFLFEKLDNGGKSGRKQVSGPSEDNDDAACLGRDAGDAKDTGVSGRAGNNRTGHGGDMGGEGSLAASSKDGDNNCDNGKHGKNIGAKGIVIVNKKGVGNSRDSAEVDKKIGANGNVAVTKKGVESRRDADGVDENIGAKGNVAVNDVEKGSAASVVENDHTGEKSDVTAPNKRCENNSSKAEEKRVAMVTVGEEDRSSRGLGNDLSAGGAHNGRMERRPGNGTRGARSTKGACSTKGKQPERPSFGGKHFQFCRVLTGSVNLQKCSSSSSSSSSLPNDSSQIQRDWPVYQANQLAV